MLQVSRYTDLGQESLGAQDCATLAIPPSPIQAVDRVAIGERG